jgi:DNA-binding transcriptional MerR regulator/methylmalonyl-CoA mutase cobalamin-binding subunit
MINISAVERDTGLSKDTLRVWERRYDFPRPGRDSNGERIYPPEQVEKLRLIRRLMDQGHRPGKILGLSPSELESLAGPPGDEPALAPEMETLVRLIKSNQLPELRRHLSQALARQGLQLFVSETVAPLNMAVGTAWVRGQIAVFEEHLYTELMQSMLRNAVAAVQPQGRTPRVLLTSLPNEMHSLGLLMVEALLTVEGSACIPLGTETPAGEIVSAAVAHKADIVALSFSAAYPESKTADGLRELRSMLPQPIELWAGGASVSHMRRDIDGVRRVLGLSQTTELVRQWRAEHGSY